MHVTCKSDKSSNVMFWFNLSHIVRKNALVIPDVYVHMDSFCENAGLSHKTSKISLSDKIFYSVRQLSGKNYQSFNVQV